MKLAKKPARKKSSATVKKTIIADKTKDLLLLKKISNTTKSAVCQRKPLVEAQDLIIVME